MAFTHGVYIEEQDPRKLPLQAESGLQVVIGLAPINMATGGGEPTAPKLIKTLEQAKTELGYSAGVDWDDYTLCQSAYMSFEMAGIGPVVYINALDPARHKEAIAESEMQIAGGYLLPEDKGIIPASVTVKSTTGADSYTAGKDYQTEFLSDGTMRIKIIPTGTIPTSAASLKVGYNKLDVTAVTDQDMANAVRRVREVYPRFQMVPGLLLCPVYSRKPMIAGALLDETYRLNGMFNCSALVDMESDAADTEDSLLADKKAAGLKAARAIPCYPNVQAANGKKVAMSALIGAVAARTDAENGDVPYVSPSNKAVDILGMVYDDDEEMVSDIEKANWLNSLGIVTCLNFQGWKTWGNRTGFFVYGDTEYEQRPEDVFIPVRRMFDWWGNSFILNYFSKVDDPMNRRLIEAVVDEENMRANGFKARFQIAEAVISFEDADNPTSDLVKGIIRFRMKLAPYTPAETIVNMLEFDADALAANIRG